MNDSLHPGSLYWLTLKGLETTKNLLNIAIGATGSSYIFLTIEPSNHLH